MSLIYLTLDHIISLLGPTNFLKLKLIFLKNENEFLFMSMNENLSIPLICVGGIHQRGVTPTWYIETTVFRI